MARTHGCHLTSREAMLFMKYEQSMTNVKVHLVTQQRKCKYMPINCVHTHLDLIRNLTQGNHFYEEFAVFDCSN